MPPIERLAPPQPVPSTMTSHVAAPDVLPGQFDSKGKSRGAKTARGKSTGLSSRKIASLLTTAAAKKRLVTTTAAQDNSVESLSVTAQPDTPILPPESLPEEVIAVHGDAKEALALTTAISPERVEVVPPLALLETLATPTVKESINREDSSTSSAPTAAFSPPPVLPMHSPDPDIPAVLSHPVADPRMRSHVYPPGLIPPPLFFHSYARARLSSYGGSPPPYSYPNSPFCVPTHTHSRAMSYASPMSPVDSYTGYEYTEEEKGEGDEEGYAIAKTVPQPVLPTENKAALSTEAAQYLRDNPLVKALQVILRGGYKVYLVGGAVEDIFRGRQPRDFDFVTDAPSSFITEQLKWELSPHKAHYFQTKLGEYSADLMGETPLDPLQENAVTRDIASSALYIALADMTQILDPTGKGISSIHSRQIELAVETTGLGQVEKSERWQKVLGEDPIRLLRIAHHCIKYGDRILPDLHAVILTQAHRLREMPAGRLRAMIKKSFLKGSAVHHFDCWIMLGLFKGLFPTIKEETYSWLRNQFAKLDEYFHLHNGLSSFCLLSLLILADGERRGKPLSDEEINHKGMHYVGYMPSAWPDSTNLETIRNCVRVIEKNILHLPGAVLPLLVSRAEQASIELRTLLGISPISSRASRLPLDSSSHFMNWCVFLGAATTQSAKAKEAAFSSSSAPAKVASLSSAPPLSSSASATAASSSSAPTSCLQRNNYAVV